MSRECFWESVGDSACDCSKCNARREEEDREWGYLEEIWGRTRREDSRESD